MTNKKIFREKSLERISSPEQLNEYIKVSGAGVWMAMTAVALLLIGVLVWAIYGNLNVYVPAVISAESGDTVVYTLCETADQSMFEGTIVFNVDNKDYELASDFSSVEPIELTADYIDELDSRVIFAGQFKEGDWIYIIKGKSSLPNGIYGGGVLSERHNPISFVTN